MSVVHFYQAVVVAFQQTQLGICICGKLVRDYILATTFVAKGVITL